jgi:hypothetical protein
VGKVVDDFRRAVPSADNTSTDGTREAALDAGAIRRQVPLRGRGNVLRRMFAKAEADAYVPADGDDIPRFIVMLLLDYRPFMFFGTLAPTGVILDSLGRSRKEVKRIPYLAVPSSATERETLGSLWMPLADI